eukprot:603659-Rhodomonas_salina.4
MEEDRTCGNAVGEDGRGQRGDRMRRKCRRRREANVEEDGGCGGSEDEESKVKGSASGREQGERDDRRAKDESECEGEKHVKGQRRQRACAGRNTRHGQTGPPLRASRDVANRGERRWTWRRRRKGRHLAIALGHCRLLLRDDRARLDERESLASEHAEGQLQSSDRATERTTLDATREEREREREIREDDHKVKSEEKERGGEEHGRKRGPGDMRGERGERGSRKDRGRALNRGRSTTHGDSGASARRRCEARSTFVRERSSDRGARASRLSRRSG